MTLSNTFFLDEKLIKHVFIINLIYTEESKIQSEWIIYWVEHHHFYIQKRVEMKMEILDSITNAYKFSRSFTLYKCIINFTWNSLSCRHNVHFILLFFCMEMRTNCEMRAEDGSWLLIGNNFLASFFFFRVIVAAVGDFL